jgi:hypothetical protein
MNTKSKSFFREIGAKGGRNGKWSWKKRESARYAANVRWARYRAVQKASWARYRAVQKAIQESK